MGGCIPHQPPKHMFFVFVKQIKNKNIIMAFIMTNTIILFVAGKIYTITNENGLKICSPWCEKILLIPPPTFSRSVPDVVVFVCNVKHL